MRPEEITAFTDQLSQLLDSDYPLAEGLMAFSGEIKKKPFKDAVQRVAKSVGEGTPLSEALAAERDAFSPEFVGLIRAGEQSGAMLEVLDAALEHESFMAKLEKRLSDALFYPIAVFVWTLVCFAAIVRLTLPAMRDFYLEFGMETPIRFNWMFTVFSGPQGTMLLVWAFLAFVFFWWIRNKVGMATMARRVPGLGGLVADVYSARLARSLGHLLDSGVSADAALAALAAATGDRGMRSKLVAASCRVAEGESISGALSAEGIGGDELWELAEIGEEGGALPGMLLRASGIFRAEADSRLEVVVRVAGSGMLVGLGAWIMLLMAGWLHAYFSLPSVSYYF